ncbi:MAG: sigma-70 family RNA polymerase sigma factor [Clostridiales bacterium]|nr:sigma-70 family RNA polymerase sigma factor [Clostridiales bacterium]
MPKEDRALRHEIDRLIAEARQGSQTAFNKLFAHYYPKIRRASNRFYLDGADCDDAFQEACIGFLKALLSYRFEANDSFESYISICIRRQLYDAVRSSKREKHRPLNDYLSIDTSLDLEDPSQFGALAQIAQDPSEIVVNREDVHRIRAAIEQRLSPFEQGVLQLYLEGASYREIAHRLNTAEKSVDNAIQRIRRKLSSLLLMAV